MSDPNPSGPGTPGSGSPSTPPATPAAPGTAPAAPATEPPAPSAGTAAGAAATTTPPAAPAAGQQEKLDLPEEIPDLNTEEGTDLPPGCELVETEKKALHVQVIRGFWNPLMNYVVGGVSALALLAVIYWVTFEVFWAIGGEVSFLRELEWAVTIPFAVVLVVVITNHQKVWISVEGLTGKVFYDPLRPNTLVVYLSWSIKPFWLKPFKDIPVVYFQKDDEIKAEKTFLTKDKMPILIGFKGLSRPVEDGLENLLLFGPGVVNTIATSVIIDRLQKLTGRNTWDLLNANRDEVMTWMSRLFCGPNVRTPLERELGILIRQLNLDAFGLPKGEAEEISKDQLKANAIAAVVNTLKGAAPEASHSEHLTAAQRVHGIKDLARTETKSEVVFKIEAPPSVHTVVIDGGAIVNPHQRGGQGQGGQGRGGKKNRGNQGKKGN